MDLPGLLSDFASVSSSSGADEAEREIFFAKLSSNADLQNVLFAALTGDAHGDSLSKVLGLLLHWYRQLTRDTARNAPRPHLVLQFLPCVLSLSLTLRRSPGRDRRRLQELEAFLLALHTQRTKASSSATPAEQVFSVPALTQTSVYHDSARAAEGAGGGTAEADRVLVRLPQFRTSSLPCRQPGAGVQSRMAVVEAMYRAFNSGLGDYSKQALDHFVRSTHRILLRGHGAKGGGGRIHLPAGVLLELLHGVYFSIYNGFQLAGGQMVELIRQRGSALGSPQVLVAVNAVRTLVLTSGPSHLPVASISTPNQIAKNLITNASFRAKKISDDIIKVRNEDNSSSAKDPMASNLKALANMASISEEVVEDIIIGGGAGGASGERTPVKTSHQGREGARTSKDKLKAKLHNLPMTGFKKRLSESDSDRGLKVSLSVEKKPEKKKDWEREKDEGSIEMKPLVKALDFGWPGKSGDKKKSADRSSSSSKAPSFSAAAAAPTANSNNDSSSTDSGSVLLPSQQQNGTQQQQQQQQQEQQVNDALVSKTSASAANVDGPIESLKQVEALLQQKKLPAETITIHSPESGTTIF